MKNQLLFILIILIALDYNYGQKKTTSYNVSCDSTSLRILTLSGSIDSLNICLNYGVDPNIPNEDGLTLLMIASAKGFDEIIKALLNKSANVNVVTKEDGITALMFAVAFEHLSAVKILVEQGLADIKIKDNSGVRTAKDWLILSKSWVVSNSKEEGQQTQVEIANYLASKGLLFIKQDAVGLVLGYGAVPDLALLLNKLRSK